MALLAWNFLKTYSPNIAGSHIKGIANTDDCFYISGNSFELSSSFIENVLRNQRPVSMRNRFLMRT